ncbi:hypothetical protein BD289DRAFT_367089 [Coniella lustricola]|uniref:Zn(2)-C6 fungal-type domain-containing protein n=1 Tax=Coniella lustricola TaxID=2025994 RepID=A0A2T3A9Y4_9PEZI|nr:hypothetical protein BD289DRAFT_367089 [Coniella lustricola]
MSTPQRRRNGSEASCEPCRQRKIKCDHEKPVCAACQRRKVQSRCWYHPSPLSRPRGAHSRRSRPLQPALITPPTLEQPFNSTTDTANSLPSVHNGSVEDTLRAHTWFSVLNESRRLLPSVIVRESYRHHAGKVNLDHERDTQYIISLLHHNFTQVEKLIEDGFSFTEISVVPSPVVRKFIASLKSTLSAHEHPPVDEAKHAQDTAELARAVITTSSSCVKISPSLDPNAFCDLFCGVTPRVEALGLLCALAAHIHFDFIAAWFGEKRDDKLANQLHRCAIMSLRLARELSTQVNDVMLWLAYEIVQVASSLEACASLAVWRLMGDLATDMYSLGLHRESLQSEKTVPFFLSQYRKRLFAITFNIEKGWSAILNSPPKIPGRYTDLQAPLDLTDDELFTLSAEDLKQVVASKLDQDGWKKVGELTSSTWARLRFKLGQIRSELVEYQFRLTDTDNESELRNISVRCHEAWESIPEYLRYDKYSAAAADLPDSIRLKLARAHLSFVHVNFHIQRVISKDRGGPPTPELLEVSFKMLEGVMSAVIDRGRAPYVCDLPADVLFYALPSAVILLAALQDAARDPERSLPPSVRKAALFRHLSVLVCQLECLAAPEDSTYPFCMHAAKIISRRLDDILEEKMTCSVTATAQTQSATGSSQDRVPADSPDSPPQCSGDDITGPLLQAEYAPTTANLSHLDGVDFETWAANWEFDTGLTNTEWGVF